MIHVDPPSELNLGDVDVRISDSIPGIPQDSDAPAFSEAYYDRQRKNFQEWERFVEDAAHYCGSELDLDPECKIIGKLYGDSFYRCMVINLDPFLKNLANKDGKTVSDTTKQSFRKRFEDLIEYLVRKLQEAIHKKSEDPDARITSRPEKESDIELPNARMANILIPLHNAVAKKGEKRERPVEITAKEDSPIVLDFSEAPQAYPTDEENVFFSGLFHKINDNKNLAFLIPSKKSTLSKELKFDFNQSMRYDIITAQRDGKMATCEFNVKYDESMSITSATLVDFKIMEDGEQTSFGDLDD